MVGTRKRNYKREEEEGRKKGGFPGRLKNVYYFINRSFSMERGEKDS
jgi:hypothetical protein